MGPPSRPAELKPTDVNDLSDVLAGSGVDLREEEAALFNRFGNTSSQQTTASFGSNAASSFDSARSNSSRTYQFSPYGNIDHFSQNIPGDRSSFYGAGTFNQPATPNKTPEELEEEARAKLVRRQAERAQYHLNDPFLLGASLHQRLMKQLRTMHVDVDRRGLYQSNDHNPFKMYIVGPDGNEVLMTLHGQDLLGHNNTMAEILTLLSLASRDRIRALIEDSGALAKGRRIGSHGVVPSELADLAYGLGTATFANARPSIGDSSASPSANPLKRKSYSLMRESLFWNKF
jgi:hypothetical protein